MTFICIAAFVVALIADAAAARYFTRVRRVSFYSGADRNRGD